MLPLMNTTKPETHHELANALGHGFAALMKIPRGTYPAILEGTQHWPTVDLLRIDLDGALLDPHKPPPHPHFQGHRPQAILARKFTFHALPLRVGPSPVHVEVAAEEMLFEYAADSKHHLWMLPAEENTCRNGTVDVRVKQNDLRELISYIAAPYAKAHGVTLEELTLHLDPLGPTSFQVKSHMIAKKMMMRARMQLEGKVSINETLVLTLGDLHAYGEGMLGSMVSGVLEPKLRALEGKQVKLGAMALGNLHLRDLKIEAGQNLHITGSFGVDA